MTTRVEIEYCVPCGLLPAAEATTHALLEALGRQLSGLTLVPSHGGVFRIAVDGETVFDKEHDGYDLDEVVRRVASRVEPAMVPLQARG